MNNLIKNKPTTYEDVPKLETGDTGWTVIRKSDGLAVRNVSRNRPEIYLIDFEKYYVLTHNQLERHLASELL